MTEKDKKIGVIIHWFDKISVAVVKLASPLKVGDGVKAKHGDSEFEFAVESMQVEHEDVKSAKKGEEVAIKFPQKAKEGWELFAAE
ncbi:MAG: Uncharacterized protein CEN90_457 [Parcubacteria group bacterium Licking1014_17]|nr:MAG: Uncharacterized protein CEN90_457 [Parcubacteria group bacterium Licking1014_17]